MIETSFQGWDYYDVVSVSSNQRVQRVGKERMSSYKLVASEHVTGPDRSVDVDPANVRSRCNVDPESPVLQWPLADSGSMWSLTVTSTRYM